MGKSRRDLVYGAIALLFCIAATLGVMFTFSGEAREKAPYSVTWEQDAFESGYIQIDAHVLQIDPLSEHFVLDLNFIPHGQFDGGDGYLTVPVVLQVDSNLQSRIEFEAGAKMHPVELALAFHEGEAENYPFDSHQTVLSMRLTEQTSESEVAIVPSQLNFYADHHNFALVATPLMPDSHGDLGYAVRVERSPLIKGTAVFWMVIIWVLTLINIILFIGVLLNRIKADFSLFGYMSGFIVAVYFFRQMFPEIPPFLGVYSDFLSIFWAILVAAGIAIVVAVKWLMGVFKNKDGGADSIG
jgi:uncharacterized protein DUF4436